MAMCAALIIVLGGCVGSGSHAAATSQHPKSSSAAAGTASASVGALRITGGYVPQPASPDVAAAYFTVRNTGPMPDTLSAVTTDVTSHVMAMTETDTGGVGAMSELGRVVIAPHSTTRFTPGRKHLMLENPSRALKQGQHITMRITFARAGTVTLTLPVVSITGPDSGD